MERVCAVSSSRSPALGFVASCKLHKLASVVSFEGEIEMSLGGMAGVGTSTTFKMKGSKMRTETASLGGFASITDTEAKKTWTLNPSTRTYTETDLAALSKASSPASKSIAKAVKTGRSDKVAGYSCDVYEIVEPGAASPTPPFEICAASGLSMIALGLTGPFAAFAQPDDAWGEVLSHGFPLRITMRDLSGKAMMTMEATRIERKSVPDSDFEVPAGYTKSASSI